MSVFTMRWIARSFVRSRPEVLFVFGDNMAMTGYGGQAKELRGEPNTVGIPTKWKPSRDSSAFFLDTDLPDVQPRIDEGFARLEAHLRAGGLVVWPEDGIGTGRACLKTCAPVIWDYIQARKKQLQQL